LASKQLLCQQKKPYKTTIYENYKKIIHLIKKERTGKMHLIKRGNDMLNSQLLKDLSNKIKRIVEESPLGDAEKNIHALLQGVFTKMELVSREEFDVQAEVLRNTREQLTLCEERLAELESLLKDK
jgi:ubiquinone biosynthesis accessory factor UbiK